ncbi:MAG: alpha/beta fold hydrolase [Nevskiales bacterium]
MSTAATMKSLPSEAELKTYFARIMAERKATVPFERFEKARIQSDGFSLHLDVIEVARGKPTVVFIPGTSVYGLVFGNFLAALADRGVNIVSVDPRGHGRSEGKRGDYSIPELVADGRAAVRYARQRFGGPIFVSGSSQGGIVAFYLAATDEALAGAICHNAADLADPRNAKKVTDHPWIAQLLRPLVLGLAKVWPGLTFNVERYYDLLSRGDKRVKNWLATDPLSLKVISIRALASLTTAKLDRPVEAIKTPVLLLHGAKDNIFPQAFIRDLYARLTCDKALKLYPDVGHFLVTDHVHKIVPDIVEWIEGRSA